jgi:hypothetical protein
MATEPEIHLAQVQFPDRGRGRGDDAVSKMTVYRLVHGGELPAARVGGRSGCRATPSRSTCASAYFDVG